MLSDVIANEKRLIRKIRSEGKIEGKAEGIAEGEKTKAIEIAKSLFDVLDIETISKKTKLTVAEVEALVNNN